MAESMDYQIKPAARQSRISGAQFAPGEAFVSIIHLDSSGELQRVDLQPEEAVQFRPEGPELGRWRRKMREEGDGEAQARREQLQNAEDLFLSLSGAPALMTQAVESPADAPDLSSQAGESIAVLRFFLALMLERKRLLRAVPGKRGDYLHVRSKTIFTVDPIALEAETFAFLAEKLDWLGEV